MGIYFDIDFPKCCWKCPASEWWDFGQNKHGYTCKAMRPGDPGYGEPITSCDARIKRQEHCPAKEANPFERKRRRK